MPRLLVRSLGLSAAAAEQGRRSKQGGKRERWRCAHPSVLCSLVRLHWGLQEAPWKRGKAGYRWKPSSFVIIIIIIIDIFCTIVSDVRFSFQYNHKLNLRQNVNALFQPKMSYIILSAYNGHSKEKGVKSSQEGPIPHIHIYFRSNLPNTSMHLLHMIVNFNILSFRCHLCSFPCILSFFIDHHPFNSGSQSKPQYIHRGVSPASSKAHWSQGGCEASGGDCSRFDAQASFETKSLI